MFFKKYEAPIGEDSDFCTEEGISQNSDSSCCAHITLKAKKPFYKKWWVWTIAGATVIITIVAVLSYRKDKQLYERILDLII